MLCASRAVATVPLATSGVLHNTKFPGRLVAIGPTITVLVIGTCRALRQ
jgi:hypothetical protein